MGVFSSRRNQIFAAVVAALVLVMVYVNLVSPIRAERLSLERQLAQKQKELDALHKQSEGASALGAAEQVNLVKARTRVPEVPDVEGLIRSMRMLETVSKMQLASYNFEIGKPEAPGKPQAPAPAAGSGGEAAPAAASLSLAVPIKLNTTAKGDYQQVHRFLEELQSSNRLMQVDKLSFAMKTSTPVKLESPRREIAVSLSLVSYYAPGLQKFYKTPLPVPFTKPEGRTNPLY
ncbi:type II secretion system protein GspM [Paenibacillus cremeus]|uniref:Pilus assembly protein PilO n=1 Tax=Paenibacillus cremeus TaxID=2163881 RepID=A0A559KE70_9BACL|nr:type II secretion system protein GspM [Paenibacillus cremeus]TVY10414.1 hypothetical protein FPZ49_08435 [Paenibacillus cremeus]